MCVRSRKRKAKRGRQLHTISLDPFFPDEEFNGWLANLELEIPHFHENAKSLMLSSAENDLVRQKILECEGTSGVQTIVVSARGDWLKKIPKSMNTGAKFMLIMMELFCAKTFSRTPPHSG